jgi:hypothetical protein
MRKKKNLRKKNSWIRSKKKTARKKTCIQECILAHAAGPAHVSLSLSLFLSLPPSLPPYFPPSLPIYLSLSLFLFLSLTALRFFMHDFFFFPKKCAATPDMPLVFASEGFFKMTQYSAAEILGTCIAV